MHIYNIYIIPYIFIYMGYIWILSHIYVCVCIYTHTHLEPRNEIGAWGFSGENGN